ncbi:helix-turn-helix transcriptional regulator [Anaerosporobacter sp.]|uniref:helix-turn-helix transcriptional regulator n=1 Tax=Anaerosporobacter sp. TaxID=1872529 RepID=UPI00286F070C|nr:helix-turn-helix transcriptional regulator [Anaerosporobacter sp.]
MLYDKNWNLLLHELMNSQEFRYIWTGIFTATSSEWTHMSRELWEFEAFFMIDGTLYIADETKHYKVSRGEYLIMPPTKKQYGYKSSFASFYWLHFMVPLSSIDRNSSPPNLVDFALQESNIEMPKAPQQKNNSIVLPNHGVIPNIERITILLSQLQETDRRYHHEYTSNSLTLGVLLELYNQQTRMEDKKSSSKEQLYQDILDYITWNKFGVIRVSDLAAYFGYHEKYISTFFKQMSGIPLKQYLVKEMMEHAKAELTTTTKSISQIAYSLGYSDSHNFTHAFKKVTGLSPSEYRFHSLSDPPFKDSSHDY